MTYLYPRSSFAFGGWLLLFMAIGYGLQLFWRYRELKESQQSLEQQLAQQEQEIGDLQEKLQEYSACQQKEVNTTNKVVEPHQCQHSVIAKLGQQGLVGKNLGELINEAIQQITEVLGVEYSSVFEVLPNWTIACLLAGVGWSSKLVGSAILGMGESSEVRYALKQEQPLIITDLRLETRFGGSVLLHNHRIISGVMIRIETSQRVFGVLGTYTTKLREFKPEEIKFLSAIAQVLSAAIERRDSEERLQLLERAVNASSNGVIITDAVATDNPVIFVNKKFEEITGYALNEIEGSNCRFLQKQDHPQPGLQEMGIAIEQGQEAYAVLRNYRKDGSLFWNELYVAPVHNTEGYLTHFIGVQTDITQRREAEEALQKSEELFRLTFDLAPIGMAITDLSGKFLRVNQSLCDAFNYSKAELLQQSFLGLTHGEDLATDVFLNQQLIKGEINQFQIEKRYLAKGGKIVHALLQVGLLCDREGKTLYLIHQIIDITDRKQMEEKLLHDACHDSLTGLANRAFFEAQVKKAIAKTQQDPEHLFAVLFLDLDRFKVVNDSLGHLVGDKLLIAIAEKLSACTSPEDTIARLGGDEFTALLENICDRNEGMQFAKLLLKQISSPFNLEGYEVFIKASIGIVFSSEKYQHPEELLRDADLAMYRAKELGKGRYEVFDQVMHESAVSRLHLENDLQRALINQEFRVYYQPIINLTTNTVTGFEALVRWQHPTKGLISPTNFIAIAQETRLIIPIGAWVIQQACAQLKAWQKQFSLPNLTISVNITVEQIHHNKLVAEITSILAANNLDSRCLKLEITESLMVENSFAANKVFSQLRKREIQLCIDDFGTGYSSLSYLYRFPIDILKIDQSFIRRLTAKNQNSVSVVKTIISLAQSLDMKVIAEGIETFEQLQKLQALGCTEGQGYYFTKPLSSQEIPAYLEKQLKK